jgi:hypothetical protein
MDSLLILVTCIIGSLVSTLWFVYQFVVKEVRWFRLTVIPWMDSISNIINPDKK